jgi:tetratricopeptide (TPR) repeat protein
MMFHYHRGWTLNRLGRYEEAIAEFDEGLKTQPDYPGAFDRRACAYAMLGRLPEALADRQRANAEMSDFWSRPNQSPVSRHDRRWAEDVVKALEAAIASGSQEPMSAPCEGSWDYGEARRERSKFLPPKSPSAG